MFMCPVIPIRTMSTSLHEPTERSPSSGGSIPCPARPLDADGSDRTRQQLRRAVASGGPTLYAGLTDLGHHAEPFVESADQIAWDIAGGHPYTAVTRTGNVIAVTEHDTASSTVMRPASFGDGTSATARRPFGAGATSGYRTQPFPPARSSRAIWPNSNTSRAEVNSPPRRSSTPSWNSSPGSGRG